MASETYGQICETFLSIIIPVYDVEKYLSQCVESVLASQISSYEILLVWKSSGDFSRKICAEYERKYPFIHVLVQKTQGLSNARNIAMDVAHGEYILFLDGDDYVDSACLGRLIHRLYETKQKPDIVVTDFCRLECSSGKISIVSQIGKTEDWHEGLDFFPKMLQKRGNFCNVWRYIYRTDFLKQNKLYFREGSMAEDIDYTTEVFLSNPNAIFSHSPFYIYRCGRKDSLMDQISLLRLRDTIRVLEFSIKRLRQSNFPYAVSMEAAFQYEYLLNLALAVEIDKKNRQAAFGLYKNWKIVLGPSVDSMVKAAASFINIFGLKSAAYALHIIKMIRRSLRN